MKKIKTTSRTPLAILYFILLQLMAINATANTLTKPPHNNMPVAATLLTGPNNVCEGETATYTASNPLSGTDPFTFSLSNPAAGTIISTTSSTITITWSSAFTGQNPVQLVASVAVEVEIIDDETGET